MNHLLAMGSPARLRGWLVVFCLLAALRVGAVDGAVDPTFQAPFLEPIPNPVLVQTDGRSLVLFGSAGGMVGLARLNTNGTVDPGFNTGRGPLIITPPIDIPAAGIHIPGATNAGSIASVALQSGGRIIVGGNFTYFADTTTPRAVLVRLKSDGTVDAAFTAGNGLVSGSGGTTVSAVAVDDTDRIYVGGRFAKVNGAARATSLVRLKSDGTMDGTFGDVTLAGLGSASVQDISVQPDHKILITTTYYSASVQPTTAVLRLLANGGLDPDFLKGTGQTSAAGGLRHVLLPNGQILVTVPPSAGLTYNGVPITGSLFRLNANGSVDLTYPSLLRTINRPGPAPDYRRSVAPNRRGGLRGRLLGDGHGRSDSVLPMVQRQSTDQRCDLRGLPNPLVQRSRRREVFGESS